MAQVIDVLLFFLSFFFFSDSGWTERADYKVIFPLSSELIWWDCFKMGYVHLLCACVHGRVFIHSFIHSIDSLLFRTNNAKEEHSQKYRSEHYFQIADYQWSSYPSSWWGSMSLVFTALIPNISSRPENPGTFVLRFSVSPALCFPPILNLKIGLCWPFISFFSFLTQAWTCKETTTHVMPPDSSGLTLSGSHPFDLNNYPKQP